MARAGSWVKAVSIGALLLASAEARAADAPRFDDKRFHVEARAGFGTPVGLYGVVLELDAFDWLAVGGGVGANGQGAQWEAHARFRPHVLPKHDGWLHAITLEGAFSRGPYANREFVWRTCWGVCDATTPQPRMISWAQAEAGVEARSPIGFTWRIGTGLALPLSKPATPCTIARNNGASVEETLCEAVPDPFLAVLSSAVGFSF